MEKQLLSEQNKAKTAEATIAGLQSVAALREKALEQYEKVQKSYERDIEGLKAHAAALADKLADAEEQIKRLKEEVSNADRIKDALSVVRTAGLNALSSINIASLQPPGAALPETLTPSQSTPPSSQKL